MYWGDKGFIMKKTNGKEPVDTLALEKLYFRGFFTSNYCGVGKRLQVPFVLKSPKIPYRSPWRQAFLLFYRRIRDFLIIHSRVYCTPLERGQLMRKNPEREIQLTLKHKFSFQSLHTQGRAWYQYHSHKNCPWGQRASISSVEPALFAAIFFLCPTKTEKEPPSFMHYSNIQDLR